VLRRGESWDGWLAAVWEGRGGIGKKKGKKKEKQRKRVSVELICTAIFRQIHRQQFSVGESIGYSAQKNPRHHAVATFKKSFSPSAIPPVLFADGIIPSKIPPVYTDGSSPSANTDGIADRIIPSLEVSDEKIPSVIPLVLSDFLVVIAFLIHTRNYRVYNSFFFFYVFLHLKVFWFLSL